MLGSFILFLSTFLLTPIGSSFAAGESEVERCRNTIQQAKYLGNIDDETYRDWIRVLKTPAEKSAWEKNQEKREEEFLFVKKAKNDL